MTDESTLKELMRTQWAAVAEDWIVAVGSKGENEHREGLLDSWMLNTVGEVSGMTVIDLGCGEGRFSRMLAERGARVTGIDLCRRFIEHAEAHRVRDEVYLEGDMEDLDGLPDAAFDLGVSYVTLVDVLDLERAIREAFRVLTAGGRFIACNLQPMVTASFAGWLRDAREKLHYKLDDYFDEGPRTLPLWDEEITNFHRTMSTYVNAFLDAGFFLEGIREPKPESTEGGRRVSVLRRQEGAPVLLG